MRSRLIRSASANGLAQLLNLLQRAVLPPLFLNAWGITGYADWLILASLTAAVSLADLGGTGYISNLLTQAHAHRDWNTYKRTLNTGLAVVSVLPALLLAIGGLAVITFDIGKFLPLQSLPRWGATAVIVILGVQAVVALPLGVIYRGYWSFGMQARGLMLYNITLAFQLLASSSALVAHAKPTIVAAASLVPFVAIGAYAMLDLRRRLGIDSLYSPAHVHLEFGRRLIKPSLQFWLISLSGTLQNQGLNLVIGTTLGPVALVLFSTTRTLVNAIKQATGLLVNTAWPEMTRLSALGDSSTLARLYRTTMRLSVTGSCVLAWVCYRFGDSIFTLWLGRNVLFDPAVLGLALVFVIQSAYWSCSSGLLVALSRVTGLATVSITAALTSVGLAWLLGKHYGLGAAMMGTILADIALPLWWAPLRTLSVLPAMTRTALASELFIPVSLLLLGLAVPWASPVAAILAIGWVLRGVRRA